MQENAAECIALRAAWTMFATVSLRKAFLQWDSWTCDRLQLSYKVQSALQHWTQASAAKSFAAWATFAADCADAKAKVGSYVQLGMLVHGVLHSHDHMHLSHSPL